MFFLSRLHCHTALVLSSQTKKQNIKTIKNKKINIPGQMKQS